MYEQPLLFKTYFEIQEEIASRFLAIRKNKKISQKELAKNSNVSYASIRRFEEKGEISLQSLVKLCLALQLYDDLERLFKVEKHYTSIEDAINDK